MALRIVVDSSVLIFLTHPAASAPVDPETGELVPHCQARVEGLLDQLDEMETELIIPTPVVSELLIKAEGHEEEILAALQGKKAVRIADFDLKSAVENAALRRSSKLLRRPAGQTKKEVTFDLQIMAIARVNSAALVLTDDQGLRKRCELAGIQVKGIADLEVPLSRMQMEIDMEPLAPPSPRAVGAQETKPLAHEQLGSDLEAASAGGEGGGAS